MVCVQPESGLPYKTGVITDISDRMSAEEARQAGEEKLRNIVEHSTNMFYSHTPEHILTYVSPQSRDILDCEPEEALKRWTEFSTDNPVNSVGFELTVKAIQTGMRQPPYELELKTGKGRIVWVEIHEAPVVKDGRTIAIVGAATDITERKRADRVLRESEEQYQRLFSENLAGNFISTADGKFLLCNLAFVRMTGFDSVEEVLKTPASMFYPDAGSREAFLRLITKSRKLELYEHDLLRRDGKIITVLENCLGYFDDAGNLTQLQGFIIDVSDRKAATEALRKERDFNQQLVQASPTYYVAIGVDGSTLMMNKAMLEALEYTLEEAIGKPYITTFVPENERFAVSRIFETLKRTYEPTKSANHLLTRSGRQLLVEWHGRQVLKETGEPDFIFGVGIDITEHTRMDEERNRLEAQMRHVQKLESLGVLAGGIAHDFNNLLVAILGNADLAMMDLAKESPAYQSAASIKQAAIRASELTNQMLAYSGKGKFIVEAVDINRMVREMTHLLDVSRAKNAALKYNFTEPLPPVMADASQLRQVVMNLITNASDAIGNQDGIITVNTGVIHADRSYLSEAFLDDNLPEGDYVFLEVSDTGCGMDAETKARIFDPFFSTKFTGRGLGLAALLGIVRGHRGAIKVYSEINRGSTFKVLFPAGEGAAKTQRQRGMSALEGWQGTGKVLVIDDEEGVRSVSRMILQRYGFDVLTAHDGVEGVQMFKENAPDLVLVLLDMTMPRMSGEEVFSEIRAIRKDIPVILTSGFSEQEATSRFIGRGLAGFIQKPFQVSVLVEKVRRTLKL
jgi:PAS domain S-box-containing protein